MLSLLLENALEMTPESVFKQQEETSLLDPGEASSSFGLCLSGKGWLGRSEGGEKRGKVGALLVCGEALWTGW